MQELTYSDSSNLIPAACRDDFRFIPRRRIQVPPSYASSMPLELCRSVSRTPILSFVIPVGIDFTGLHSLEATGQCIFRLAGA
jgi:hypothetical protein